MRRDFFKFGWATMNSIECKSDCKSIRISTDRPPVAPVVRVGFGVVPVVVSKEDKETIFLSDLFPFTHLNSAAMVLGPGSALREAYA